MRYIERMIFWADERSIVVHYLNQFLHLNDHAYLSLGLDIKNHRMIVPRINSAENIELMYMLFTIDTMDTRFLPSTRALIHLSNYVLLLNLNKPNALELLDQVILTNLDTFQVQPLYIIGVSNPQDHDHTRMISSEAALEFCAGRNIKYIENTILSNLEILQLISFDIHGLPLPMHLVLKASETFQKLLCHLTIQHILGKPLSITESELLSKFGSAHDRSLLELYFPLDYPLIQQITGHLTIPNANGRNLLL